MDKGAKELTAVLRGTVLQLQGLARVRGLVPTEKCRRYRLGLGLPGRIRSLGTQRGQVSITRHIPVETDRDVNVSTGGPGGTQTLGGGGPRPPKSLHNYPRQGPEESWV